MKASARSPRRQRTTRANSRTNENYNRNPGSNSNRGNQNRYNESRPPQQHQETAPPRQAPRPAPQQHSSPPPQRQAPPPQRHRLRRLSTARGSAASAPGNVGTATFGVRRAQPGSELSISPSANHEDSRTASEKELCRDSRRRLSPHSFRTGSGIGIPAQDSCRAAFYGSNDRGLWHGSVIRMKFLLCYNLATGSRPQPLNQRPKESQKTCLQRD